MQGFRQDCLKGGRPKGVGVWGSSIRRKQIQSFEFECLKWPILAEITAKSAIYFYFHIFSIYFLPNKGEDIPPVVLRGGSGPPPPPLVGNPVIWNEHNELWEHITPIFG